MVSATSDKVQVLSKAFYDSKKERDYTLLCKEIQPPIYQQSLNVLRDHDLAMINVNDVLLKIYNNMMGILTDEKSKPFIYDDSKSFLHYVNLIAHNKAKMKYNQNKRSRIKYVFESSTDEDDSNQLVDILPMSSKEYFDLNNEQYSSMIGDMNESSMNKCDIIRKKDTIIITPTIKDKSAYKGIPMSGRFVRDFNTDYVYKIIAIGGGTCTMKCMSDDTVADHILKAEHINNCVTSGEMVYIKELIPNKILYKIKESYKKLIGDVLPANFIVTPTLISFDGAYWIEILKNESTIDAYFNETLSSDTVSAIHKWVEDVWAEKSYAAAPKKYVGNDEIIREIEVNEFIHNSDKLKYEKVLEIIGNFNSSDVLMDAMANMPSYAKVAEKHDIGTPSAIKTRVFRCKKIIDRIMSPDDIWSRIHTEGYIYTGAIKLYHTNGKPKLCGHFETSVRHGKFTFYYDNGCIKKIIHYDRGIKHGEYMEYDMSGALLIDGSYENGMRHGTWKYYVAKAISAVVDFYMSIPGYYEKFQGGQIVDYNIYSDGCSIAEVVV